MISRTDFLKHVKITQYLCSRFCQKDISGEARTTDYSGEIAVRMVFAKIRRHRGLKSGWRGH